MKINAVVEGRPKHYWSIYQKMIVKGRDFDDIHDLVGVRILCDEVRDCYAAVGVVHSLWQPMAGRFKDYIAQPRYGVYQSLHTTVVGPEGKPLEVQIRTHDMHRTAEFGIAAHWRYKETKGRHSGDVAEVDDRAWMRQLLDWQREAADPGEFLESLRYDLAVKEIFVFTPKGDVVTLPAGSTPVDFAYAVHTEVGHRCIGARVNGRLVALERKLENGEVVEVFTSKAVNAGPSRDWQTFVVSPRAKTKIRQWFAKERREEALEAGKDAIAKEVRRVGLPLQRLMNAESMASIAHELHYTDVSMLYTAVGESHVSAQHVVQRLVAHLGGVGDVEEELAERSTPSTMPMRPRSTGDAGVLVPGAEGTVAKLAKCCTPVPGDEIMGFVTRGGAVSVHRTDCTNAGSLQEQSERIIEVKWAPSPSSVFLVAIQIEALDRHRLLSDVTKALADEKVNILSASVTTSGDRVAISKFTFEMGDPKHLGHVLNVVRNVEGVYDVYRVTSAAYQRRTGRSFVQFERPSRSCSRGRASADLRGLDLHRGVGLAAARGHGSVVAVRRDLLDRREALLGDRPEHGVVGREHRVGVDEEELAAVTAGGPAVRHRDRAAGVDHRIRECRIVRRERRLRVLGGEAVARSAGALPAGITSLQDLQSQLRRQPVAGCVVEVALLGEAREAVDRARGLGTVEDQADRSGARLEVDRDGALGGDPGRGRRRDVLGSGLPCRIGAVHGGRGRCRDRRQRAEPGQIERLFRRARGGRLR
jgi:RelA/SpoT family (p)ppGpp synthetase